MCGAPDVPFMAGRSCGRLPRPALDVFRNRRPASGDVGALYALFVCRGAEVQVVFDRRNGTQLSARPFRMHFEHGKVPLQRFLEARHARQASGARRRLAGRTLGRGIGENQPNSQSGHGEYKDRMLSSEYRGIVEES